MCLCLCLGKRMIIRLDALVFDAPAACQIRSCCLEHVTIEIGWLGYAELRCLASCSGRDASMSRGNERRLASSCLPVELELTSF